jgi:hypothetical protein
VSIYVRPPIDARLSACGRNSALAATWELSIIAQPQSLVQPSVIAPMPEQRLLVTGVEALKLINACICRENLSTVICHGPDIRGHGLLQPTHAFGQSCHLRVGSSVRPFSMELQLAVDNELGRDATRDA